MSLTIEDLMRIQESRNEDRRSKTSVWLMLMQESLRAIQSSQESIQKQPNSLRIAASLHLVWWLTSKLFTRTKSPSWRFMRENIKKDILIRNHLLKFIKYFKRKKIDANLRILFVMRFEQKWTGCFIWI